MLFPLGLRGARAVLLGLGVSTLAASSAACDRASIEDVKPPPEVSGLEEAYKDPKGSVSAENLQNLADKYAEQLSWVETTNQLAVLGDLSDQLSSKQLDFVAGPDDLDPTEGAKLRGLVRLTRICRGPEGDDIVDAERFGTVTMVGKASERGLYPVIWGTLENCSDHVDGGGAFTIDGSYFLVLRKQPDGKVDRLLSVRGTIENAQGSFEGRLDFRVLGDGRVEVRVPAEDGDVVIGLKTDAAQTLRDRASQWDCKFDQLSCENEKTGDVVQADRVVTP
jgi:hypothetical protein